MGPRRLQIRPTLCLTTTNGAILGCRAEKRGFLPLSLSTAEGPQDKLRAESAVVEVRPQARSLGPRNRASVDTFVQSKKKKTSVTPRVFLL